MRMNTYVFSPMWVETRGMELGFKFRVSGFRFWSLSFGL